MYNIVNFNSENIDARVVVDGVATAMSPMPESSSQGIDGGLANRGAGRVLDALNAVEHALCVVHAVPRTRARGMEDALLLACTPR